MPVRRRQLVCAGVGLLGAMVIPRGRARAAAPRPILDVPLSARVGETVRLGLALPWGEGFATANVGRLFVRTARLQEDVPVTAASDGRVPHVLTSGGPTLVVVSAGPGDDRGRPDAWARATHCAKAFVRVAGTGAGGGIDPGTTAKVGLPIELMPLVSPLRIRVGADLPVRAYFHNGKQAGAQVRAQRPDGTSFGVTTDAVGTAAIRIDRPGRWIVRFAKRHAGRDHAAELVFEVPPTGGPR